MSPDQWKNLEGGYRTPYDPRPALDRLRQGDSSAWDELWEELHHQGDVGLASYAAVPELIQIHRERNVADWNTYGLIGLIESCRGKGKNPSMPDWLTADYKSAWNEVIPLACRDLASASDETTITAILGAIAMAKNIRPLADLLLDYSGEELNEMAEAFTND